jgi:hypothetical protein
MYDFLKKNYLFNEFDMYLSIYLSIHFCFIKTVLDILIGILEHTLNIREFRKERVHVEVGVGFRYSGV